MKIAFVGVCSVPSEEVARNRKHSESLGLKGPTPSSSRRLAVIGGGPSIHQRIDELRAFDGDRWIVGSSFPFCLEHGIEGLFYCMDPHPLDVVYCGGVSRALIASHCDPAVFEALKDAAVSVFDSTEYVHGSTTASMAPALAVSLGYTEISFYGCESCYGETTHAYMDIPDPQRILVRCDGRDFLTKPEFLLQAEYLATMVRLAPEVYLERSGGLLAAMVRDLDYDITHATPLLIERVFGKAA